MSYVQSVLQPGEKIVLQGRLHWIAYWPAILLLTLGIALLSWEWSVGYGKATISITAIAFGALCAYFSARAWFIRWITEIAVTNRRIIYKRGFINRHTEEMNMDKVASVDVDQSILGRLLDYGNVHVIGTGGALTAEGLDDTHDGIENLRRIEAPINLRNAITAK
jgi:uncharacterized membrane protein YdbT with pleckstrin-like domain